MKTASLCVSAWLALVCSLSAGDSSVQVISASEELVESHPRQIVTSVFFVTNWTDDERVLTPEIDLPTGWQLLASDRILRLAPGQREMSLVSFLIPRTAQAGSYTVGYALRYADNGDYGGSSTIRVDVIPVTSLSLEILDCPDFVVAGEPYEVSTVLINQGNTTADIDVSVSSRTGFPMEGSERGYVLDPGQSAVFRVGVKTDPGLRKVTRERLTITARSVNPPGTREQAWCHLEILPRITGTGSRYRRLPAMASISYLSEDGAWDRSKAQASLSGSGNLNAEGTQHVDFVFRGPDLGQNRLLGNRDEYFLDYRYKNHSVVLGDHSYSVSPLTENHHYGRGGEYRAAFKRLGVSAYQMESRWGEPDEKQTAAALDYHFGDDSLVGVRYLKKSHQNTGEMLSLETRMHPADATGLEMEYAEGLPGHDENKAYRLKLMTLASWGSYLLRFIHADARYPGYFQNMDFISTSLGLNLSRDLRIDGSVRQERHNLNLDPTGYTAPLERDYRVRLVFRSGTAIDYSLAYRFRESTDQFAEPLFDSRERSARGALSCRYDTWDCNVAAELGRTFDRLTDRTQRLERYTASVRLKPNLRHSYHGYLYYDRNFGPAQHERHHLSAGMTASVLLGSRTALEASIRSNIFEDLDNLDRDVFELSLRQRLFEQTELVFRGHYTEYHDDGESHDLAFMVEYNIPFGMPVNRRADVGSLKGKVYDLETGTPLPDVILRLDGSTAVSDRAGWFSFPTAASGTHFLKVDGTSIGLERITSRRFPMEIKIQGGKTTSIEVPVVRGAKLKGRVDLYSYEDSTSGVLTPESQRRLTVKRGMAGVMVELTDGYEVRRTLTATDGSFSMEELRPGIWTLAIPAQSLPENHAVAESDIRVHFEPGAEETLAVRIVPRERPLRIIEDGGTLIERPLK
jgi:hypothetical protein